MSATPPAPGTPDRAANSPRRPAPAGAAPGQPATRSPAARARAYLSTGPALVAALLAAAVGFNLWVLAPEVTTPAPPLNDYVLHGVNLGQTLGALLAGGNPTDFWSPTIALGYPLFRYYQHFAYLPPALLALLATRVLHAAVSLPGLLTWTGYLLLAVFPLAFYWSMRRFGFDRLAAAGGALVSSLIATNFLYGFEYGSYVWRGSGLYTQLWGMLLLPMALAQGYVALKTGRGYFLAVLLLAVLLLSHLVLGYIGLASLVFLALLIVIGDLARRRQAAGRGWPAGPRRGGGGLSRTAGAPTGDGSSTHEAAPAAAGARPERIALRLALLLALAGLVTAYFFLPFLRDGAYMNRSVWELQTKYDAFGAAWTLKALFTGQLFDYGRFPSLTLLLALGLVACLLRWRDERYRIPVVLFGAWLLLYFGRPTWGALMDLLPMGHDLQLHRLIAGVHLGGLMLIGAGLGAACEWVIAGRDRRYALAGVALLVLLLFPVYRERYAYMAQDKAWAQGSAQAYAAESKDLSALFAALRSLPPGRVYAGLAANWGKTYTVGSAPMYALLNANGFDMVGFLYHALSLNADVEVLFDDALAWQYDLFDVRYVVVPSNFTVPGFYRRLGTFGRHSLYEVPTSGYFEVVAPGPAFAGDKSTWYPAAASWLKSGLAPAGEHPVLDVSGARGQALPLALAPQAMGSLPVQPAPAAGAVRSESVGDGTYQATVDVPTGGMVMLKETYHPGWQATVDGAEAPTVMLMPSYIGVEVTPGVHVVRLEYRPGPERAPLMWLGLLLLGALGLAELAPGWRSGAARAASWRSLRARVGAAVSWALEPQASPDAAASAPGGGAPGAGGLWASPAATGAAGAPGEQGAPRWEGEAGEGPGKPHEQGIPGGPGSARAALSAARASLTAIARRLRGTGPRGPALAGGRTLAGIYLLFLAIYLVSGMGHFWSTDHITVYLTTQSLVERGGLAIKPVNGANLGPDGRAYGHFGLAQSVLSIPFYLVGKLVDGLPSTFVHQYFGGQPLGDWGGTVPIFFVSLFNQFVAPLVCLVVFLFGLRLGFPRRVALAVTLVYGLGTWAWVGAHDYFQHPLETLLLLATVYVLFARRTDLQPRDAALAGLTLAAGLFARVNLVVLAPFMGCYALWIGWRRPGAAEGHEDVPAADASAWPGGSGGSLRPLLLRWRELLLRTGLPFALPALAALAVIMWLNHMRWGAYLNFNPDVSAEGFTLAGLPAGLYGNLLSPGRSVFLYSPPVLLGLVGFWPFFRRQRVEAGLFLAIAAATLLFFSAYGYWDGGWAWGPRYLAPTIPFLVLPLGYLFGSFRRLLAIAAAAALGAGVQVLGVAVNVSYVYWDWVRMNLSPATANLYVPELSAVPTHLRDLLAGYNVDLWLVWVYHRFGPGVAAASVVPPALILAGGLYLLDVRPRSIRRAWRESASLAAARAGLERLRSAVASQLAPPEGGTAAALAASLGETLEPAEPGARPEAGLARMEARPSVAASAILSGPASQPAPQGPRAGPRAAEGAPASDEVPAHAGPRAAGGESVSMPPKGLPVSALGARVRAHLPYLAGVAAMALLAGLPLLQLRMMSGHDAFIYLPRNIEFFRSLAAGQWFPRWAPDFGAGYGEPTFAVAPPLIYYLSAAFHALGATFVGAADLACLAVLLLAGAGMYFLSSEAFGRRGGLVSATAYLFAPYLLVNLYVRSDFTDFAAFAFIPWAFWGLYGFAGGRRWSCLACGALAAAGLFLSSNSVALMAFPALLLFAAWLAWAERSRRVLLRGLWCAALGAGLAGFYWLPALQEKGFLHFERLAIPALDYRNHFIWLSQLVYSPWGFGLSWRGPQSGLSYGLGFVHLALLAAALLCLCRIRSLDRKGWLFVSFAVAMVALGAFFSSTLSQFIWDRLPLLQVLQFPWRFLTLAAAGTALLCGFPFLLLARARPRLADGVMAALMLAILAVELGYAHPQGFEAATDADYAPAVIAGRHLNDTTENEWEPTWAKVEPQAPAGQPLTFLTGQGQIMSATTSPGAQDFVVQAPQGARLQANTFYYPGWTVFVDGVEQPAYHDDPQGLMQFTLPPGLHAVRVVYLLTPFRQWAARLSLLALLLLAASPVLWALRARLWRWMPEGAHVRLAPAPALAGAGAGLQRGPLPAAAEGREPAPGPGVQGPRTAARWLALVPLFALALLGWFLVKPTLSPQASYATPTPTPGLGYEGYMGQSLAYYNEGDYPSSIGAAGMALRLVPRSSLAYNNICASENQLKQWDQAIQACQQALAIEPSLALAQNNLAAARQGKAAASGSASPQPPAATPQTSPTPPPAAAPGPSATPQAAANPGAGAQADALIAASLAAYQAGDYQGCVQAAQRSLALRPDYALAYNNICACDNALHQWDQAIAACQKALAIEPGFTLAQNNLKVAQRGQR
jgi:hypothetical protein